MSFQAFVNPVVERMRYRVSAGLKQPAAPHHQASAVLIGHRYRLRRMAVNAFDPFGQHQRQALAFDRIIDIGRDGKSLAGLDEPPKLTEKPWSPTRQAIPLP